MKRTVIPLIATVLILSGCGSGDSETAKRAWIGGFCRGVYAGTGAANPEFTDDFEDNERRIERGDGLIRGQFWGPSPTGESINVGGQNLDRREPEIICAMGAEFADVFFNND